LYQLPVASNLPTAASVQLRRGEPLMPVSRTLIRSIRVALALAVLGLPSLAAARQIDGRSETFRWQGPIAPGQTLEVRNVNGPVRAEPSASGQVEIQAIKTGRFDDPRGVRIVVVPHGDGVTVCSVYPDVDGKPNECLPGGGGRNTVKDNDVRVEFLVKVPAGVSFAGRNVNGNVIVKDLEGRARVDTVNGSVELNTTGYATAKTVNGSITMRIGQANWEDPLELKTVNGSIELHVPADISADLTAKTVNGRIESDLPITVRQMDRRSLRGTLGAGGRGLSLETVNGSIAVKTGGE
jgi:Putative adhesin